MLSHPTSPPPEQPPGPTDTEISSLESVLHDAWVEIADGMLQGCPDPLSFQVAADMSWVWLTVAAADHVATWAAYLRLTRLDVHRFPRDRRDGPARVWESVHTVGFGIRPGVTWTVSHVDHHPSTDGAAQSPAESAPLDGDR